MASVAVIGASSDRNKFGNKCVRAYLNQQWTVYPIHPKHDEIEGLKVYRKVSDIAETVERIALYVTPDIGITYLDDIANAGKGEIFINPGTGNSALRERATELEIPYRDSCAITAIGENPSDYSSET